MRMVLAALALLLAAGAYADVDARLDQARQAIEAHLQSSQRPGLVIGITDRQRLREVVVHGYSDLKTRTPLTAQSRFAIGSISKAFTAIALMQLADEGRFDPHAPITRYVPSFAMRSKYPPVTGHDLLSHTAGLPYYLPDTASSRAALLSLKDFEPTYAPGAHWEYSNTGFQVMGYALENIEAAKYDAIVQRRVLERLGMSSTSAIIDDAQRDHMTVSYTRWPYDGSYVESSWFEYLAADGSIVSTVSDMAAYTRFYLNRGQGPKDRVLSEQSFKALTTPVLENYAYGLDVREDKGHRVISHGGGIAGFRSHIEAHPDEGFALVFLSNGGMDESLRPWVVELARAAFADQPLPAAPAPDADPLMAPLGDYAGHFRAGEGKTRAIDVRLVGDELLLAGPEGKRRLQRMGVNTFRAEGEVGDSQGYFFARTDDKPEGAVIGVSHGIDWYSTAGRAPAPPKEYAAYVGHYVNNGPEGPVARIYVRDGKLVAAMYVEEIFAPLPLTPLGEGVFRLGKEDYSPERAKFDGILDGHAQRLTIDGVPLYRRETP
ncbi:MAG TPA: serine hydrolase domain-containing protein [Steroidobacteraceae bacterium]|jgi:CubicO group peptidase (beta-lactamase class C family)